MPNPAFAMPSTLQMLLGLYAYLLPLLLYVAWSTLALWDIGRRPLGTRSLWAWVLAVFLVPFAGAGAYLLGGGATVSRDLRIAVVIGGLALYGLVLIVGAGAGGVS